jgi:hypothetical protein
MFPENLCIYFGSYANKDLKERLTYRLLPSETLCDSLVGDDKIPISWDEREKCHVVLLFIEKVSFSSITYN